MNLYILLQARKDPRRNDLIDAQYAGPLACFIHWKRPSDLIFSPITFPSACRHGCSCLDRSRQIANMHVAQRFSSQPSSRVHAHCHHHFTSHCIFACLVMVKSHARYVNEATTPTPKREKGITEKINTRASYTVVYVYVVYSLCTRKQVTVP
jgi:hypothetical protein